MSKTPHKHAQCIKAWADGTIIQIREDDGSWHDVNWGSPIFDEKFEYRIKPAEPEKAYPITGLTAHQLQCMRDIDFQGCGSRAYLPGIVNKALRHACDSGQIVTRTEFDRAVGDRNARDLAIALAVRQAVQNRTVLTPTFVQGRRLSITFENFDVLDIIAGVKP